MSAPIEIARPGDDAAATALIKYRRGLRNPPGWYLGLIAIVWTDESSLVTRIIGWSVLGVTGAAVLGAIGLYLLRRRRYRAHVAAGNIVRLTPLIVDTWDELRREEDIPLTANERNDHLRGLFATAGDLAPHLDEYIACHGRAELHDRALRAEAHIRVRLRQEVTALRDVLETRRKMALSAGEIHDDSPEIQTEMQRLRQAENRTDQDA